MRRQIPDLVRPRRWPGRRTARVGYELGRAVVLWWLVDRRRAKGDRSLARAGISRRMRVAAETLGPTYIKLGQIISSGAGIFPEELVTEFAKCRDQVPAEDFDTVRRVLEEELGKRLEDVFVEFDRVPLAAASIAQVHRAVLHPSTPGEPALEVVVKVQRPDVGRLVHDDLRVMAWLAPFLVGRIPVTALANPPALVE
ncbi:MAG: AarF/UbiB family protein, partial [Candidatus Limnocylindrales bacterium]